MNKICILDKWPYRRAKEVQADLITIESEANTKKEHKVVGNIQKYIMNTYLKKQKYKLRYQREETYLL